jgi:hypothetical protein
MGEIIKERKLLDGMHDWKKPFRNLTRRWKYNIKMDLGEIACRSIWLRM